MSFRFDEARDELYHRGVAYLTKSLPPAMQAEAKDHVDGLVDKYGPFIGSYPTWHPLMCNANIRENRTSPDSRQFDALDHVRKLRDGFVTCPYDDGAQKIVDEVNRLEREGFNIEAEILDFKLYSPQATTVLVKMKWPGHILMDGTYDQRTAVGLMVQQITKGWDKTACGESWENVREYYLGIPCGGRSSLFVNERTGAAIKKVHKALVESGMFGPVHFAP